MGRAGRADRGLREGVPWSESLVLAPLKIYLFVLLEAASRKHEDITCSSLVGSPLLNLLLFLPPAGPGKRGLAQPTRGPTSEVTGQVGAEAVRALRETGRRQAGRAGGGKAGGGSGELASPQLASCGARRITGKQRGQAEMSGREERAGGGGGDVGHGRSGPQGCGVESLARAQLGWPSP